MHRAIAAMPAMRQNSPFAGVLTPKERWAIYDEFAAGGNQERRAPSAVA